jgi:hypothetical protein
MLLYCLGRTAATEADGSDGDDADVVSICGLRSTVVIIVVFGAESDWHISKWSADDAKVCFSLLTASSESLLVLEVSLLLEYRGEPV